MDERMNQPFVLHLRVDEKSQVELMRLFDLLDEIEPMDRETAQIVRRACEFYSRAVCGQIDETLLEAINAWSERDDAYFAIREQLEDSLKRVKTLLFPELPADAHYGIGHNRNADLAWNINQVLR